ncbi:PGPGW domain-containing protein [Mucisphaera calidilacus]|uniref:Transmembrane protein (PGPGW) n=1 Tax=Mucisphaera calidilacus TaxID=2527982 RepID=A0A518BWQ7_9BACT|nr:PGPGW domain-containing protein [Mucisphaera calidilacus]QDU71410.1 Putative transmembrane protein (PGPGW) [Mucisphaera calidilacus]
MKRSVHENTPLPHKTEGLPVTGRLPARVRTPKWLRRIGIGIIGFTIILIGLVLFILPAPLGWFVVPVGLVILGTEFVWARQLLIKIRARHSALEKTLGTAEKYAEALEDTLFGPEEEDSSPGPTTDRAGSEGVSKRPDEPDAKVRKTA